VDKFIVHRKKEVYTVIPVLLDHSSYQDRFQSFPICGKGGQSHIFGGSKRVEVTIESYGKLEILYINVDNF
jgi:hypothetical protein